jgi:predicted PurR-regulated permease PerM
VARTNQGWLGQMVSERLPEAEKSLSGVAAQAAGWLGSFAGSLWAGGKAVVSVVSLIVITPVVTFYLLLDWDRMIEKIDSWIPRPHRETVRQLLGEVDDAIAGFMRGQALCCLFLGTFYCIGLSLVGLNFALLIGLIAGVFSFVPYLGAMTGLLLAGSVAIAQFWPDWIPIAMTLGVFAAGQALEGNVLQPYLVGAKIGLHPVWLMFALLAFGYVFGFVGLLIAVPVAASIGVLVRFLLRQYLASPYYTGG